MANQTIDIGQAKSAFNKIAEAIPLAVSDFQRDLSGLILKLVVGTTPVDTGLARSNWIVSLDAPSSDLLEPWVPYEKFSGPKIGESANAEATIKAGLDVLSAFQEGDTIYVQNNVDYIGLLNDGSSQQAPAGFVEAAVLASAVFATSQFGRYLANYA